MSKLSSGNNVIKGSTAYIGLSIAFIIGLYLYIELGLQIVAFLGLMCVLGFAIIRKPKFIMFVVFILMVFNPAGVKIPIANLRDFGLMQLLFPIMFVSSYVLLKKGTLTLTKIDCFLLFFTGWYCLIILIHFNFSPAALWRAFIVIPWFFTWIAAKAFIQNTKDLRYFVFAMVIQAIIISIFSIYDYYTQFNLYAHFNSGEVNVEQLTRFGFLRASGGLFPHPVPAAVYLSLIFPLSFLYIAKQRTLMSLLCLVSACLSLIAFYYLQGRGAIYASLMIFLVAIIISNDLRAYVLNFKMFVPLLIFGTILFFGMKEFINYLIFSLDQTQPESINLFTRIIDYIPAISTGFSVPFLGYGLNTEATISVFGFVNEQPWFIDNWYKGGIVYGLMSELYLIFGAVYFFKMVRKRSQIPWNFRMACFIGFVAQGISMHLNRDSYGLYTSILMLGAMEAAEQVYKN